VHFIYNLNIKVLIGNIVKYSIESNNSISRLSNEGSLRNNLEKNVSVFRIEVPSYLLNYCIPYSEIYRIRIQYLSRNCAREYAWDEPVQR